MFRRRTLPTTTFGVALEQLNKRDNSEVPKIVLRLCDHIITNGIGKEGLFRLPGNARVIRELTKSFDDTGDADLESHNITASCSLLKKFLRDLPAAIIPDDIQEELLRHHASEGGMAATDIKQVIDTLPPVNKATVQYLFDFLDMVANNSSENKVSALQIHIVL